MNDRCSLCQRTHRQVFPDGPTDAKIMLIGEGPGKQEDASGVPFVGNSGQELDPTYLRIAGLSRSEIYVTNAVQCRCERGGVDVKPSYDLTDMCSMNHLPAEIYTVQPEVIILCGATACSLANGFGQPGIDLEYEHGRPRKVKACARLGGWVGTIIPMYHPAAGMHDTRYMTPMLEDWEKFGKWLRGKHTYGQGDSKPTDYRLLRSADNVREYFSRHWNAVVAVDTESDEGRIWSIQFSFKPGNAAMVLTSYVAALREVGWALNRCDEIIMHHATHDIDELSQVGIRPRAWRDTMQELYHLGNLPQGLKAAVYRIFGYKMTSYADTVTPHSKRALEGWLAEALVLATDSMRETEPHPPGKDCPTCGKNHRLDVSKQKPHEAEAVIRRVMKYIGDGPDATDYDPWQKPKYAKGKESCRLLGREWMADIETVIGRMPRQSIVHAPLGEAVRYGCSDADWTLRLAHWLAQERARIVKEEWQVWSMGRVTA